MQAKQAMLQAKPRAFQPAANAHRHRSLPRCSGRVATKATQTADAYDLSRRSSLALLLGGSAYAMLQPGEARAGLPATVGSYLPPYGDGSDNLVLFVPDSKKTPVRAAGLGGGRPRTAHACLQHPPPAPPSSGPRQAVGS
jgi:hypothetical protein